MRTKLSNCSLSRWALPTNQSFIRAQSLRIKLQCYPLLEFRLSGLERNMARVIQQHPLPKAMYRSHTGPTSPATPSHQISQLIWITPLLRTSNRKWRTQGAQQKGHQMPETQCCQFPTEYHLTGLQPSGGDSPECANIVNGDLISVNESMFLFGSNNR